MKLDHDVCFRALAARDPRFDGMFFVGVRTTHIYCRPVCPARTPKRNRCCFFADAAAAERDGFRPCLRCRPELAPGLSAVDSTRRLARLAIDRIEAGALNHGGTVEGLAEELGVSGRQLRRVIRQECGVSPIQLAQTRRLLLAKQLLMETEVPIIDVALASGFESVRRFNALFRSRYGLSPGQIRRSAAPVSGDCVRLALAYRPPYAWGELLEFLREHATAGIERVERDAYLRTVAMDQRRGWVKVEPLRDRDALSVSVAIDLLPVLPRVLARLRSLFDLDARPDVIASHLALDRRLAASVESAPGLRVPGAFDEFDCLVRVILGQLVSVSFATTLAGRLASRFGAPIRTPYDDLDRLPPRPETLVAARPSQLTKLGIASTRADCIRAVSKAVADGQLQLATSVEPLQAIRRLKQLPGIGEWTAQSVAMRAIHWPDAFPDGDLSLRRICGLESPQALRRVAEAWRPWRAYAAMHLWNCRNLPRDGDGNG